MRPPGPTVKYRVDPEWHRVDSRQRVLDINHWLDSLHRPPSTWSCAEVCCWAALGRDMAGADMPWLADLLERNCIDGPLLVELTKEQLAAHLHITDPGQQAAVLGAIQELEQLSADVAADKLPLAFFVANKPARGATQVMKPAQRPQAAPAPPSARLVRELQQGLQALEALQPQQDAAIARQRVLVRATTTAIPLIDRQHHAAEEARRAKPRQNISYLLAGGSAASTQQEQDDQPAASPAVLTREELLASQRRAALLQAEAFSDEPEMEELLLAMEDQLGSAALQRNRPSSTSRATGPAGKPSAATLGRGTSRRPATSKAPPRPGPGAAPFVGSRGQGTLKGARTGQSTLRGRRKPPPGGLGDISPDLSDDELAGVDDQGWGALGLAGMPAATAVGQTGNALVDDSNPRNAARRAAVEAAVAEVTARRAALAAAHVPQGLSQATVTHEQPGTSSATAVQWGTASGIVVPGGDDDADSHADAQFWFDYSKLAEQRGLGSSQRRAGSQAAPDAATAAAAAAIHRRLAQPSWQELPSGDRLPGGTAHFHAEVEASAEAGGSSQTPPASMLHSAVAGQATITAPRSPPPYSHATGQQPQPDPHHTRGGLQAMRASMLPPALSVQHTLKSQLQEDVTRARYDYGVRSSAMLPSKAIMDDPEVAGREAQVRAEVHRIAVTDDVMLASMHNYTEPRSVIRPVPQGQEQRVSSPPPDAGMSTHDKINAGEFTVYDFEQERAQRDMEEAEVKLPGWVGGDGRWTHQQVKARTQETLRALSKTLAPQQRKCAPPRHAWQVTPGGGRLAPGAQRGTVVKYRGSKPAWDCKPQAPEYALPGHKAPVGARRTTKADAARLAATQHDGSRGDTLLHWLASQGDAPGVFDLLFMRSSALRGGSVTAAAVTVEQMASAANWAGETPLHKGAACAAPCALTVMQHLLTASRAAVNARDQYGRTPLHTVIMTGSTDSRLYERVKLLLAAGAQPSIADSMGETPLHHAVQRSHCGDATVAQEDSWCNVLQLLLAASADVNARNVKGQTPLMHAVMRPHMHFNRPVLCSLHLLMAQGADANAADEGGCTPLHYCLAEAAEAALAAAIKPLNHTQRALINGKHQRLKAYAWITRTLLAGGANPNATDAQGRTPLTMATAGGADECADVLRQYGASSTMPGPRGRTQTPEQPAHRPTAITTTTQPPPPWQIPAPALPPQTSAPQAFNPSTSTAPSLNTTNLSPAASVRAWQQSQAPSAPQAPPAPAATAAAAAAAAPAGPASTEALLAFDGLAAAPAAPPPSLPYAPGRAQDIDTPPPSPPASSSPAMQAEAAASGTAAPDPAPLLRSSLSSSLRQQLGPIADEVEGEMDGSWVEGYAAGDGLAPAGTSVPPLSGQLPAAAGGGTTQEEEEVAHHTGQGPASVDAMAPEQCRLLGTQPMQPVAPAAAHRYDGGSSGAQPGAGAGGAYDDDEDDDELNAAAGQGMLLGTDYGLPSSMAAPEPAAGDHAAAFVVRSYGGDEPAEDEEAFAAAEEGPSAAGSSAAGALQLSQLGGSTQSQFALDDSVF